MKIYILNTFSVVIGPKSGWSKQLSQPNVMVLVPKLFSMYLMKKSLLLWWLFSGAESEDPTIENYQLHV